MNKMFQSLVVLLVVSFSLSTFSISHAEVGVTEDSWETMEPMPEARSTHGVAVVNGKIYVIGGSYLSINEEYDPATDTWTTKTPMPTPRGYFGVAVYQNKIYVMGGQVGGQDPTGVNEVYDPSTDTWETKTSMPTPRKYLSANVVNGKIYLIGGCQYVPHSANLDVNEVYDPTTDSWTTKTPIPTGIQGYASAVVDNKIYIIEGMDFSLNQIYDPETDSWSFGEPSPTALNFAAAGATTGVAAPKRIYVIGGYTIQGMDVSGLVRVYNPEADVWTEGTSMPTPRYSLGVAVVNDVLYAIGGGTGWFMPETAQNEQYTPIGYGHALGTIYIRSNGRVDPGTAPIQRDGNVYTFTRNIYGEIVVEKDNVVVDGAGYTLQGTGSGKGIELSDRSNVTIQNVEIKEVDDGIWLYNASNNAITGNTITNNDYGGIVFLDSDNNTISGNTVTSNSVGVDFTASENNIVSGNLIANNDEDGIHLENINNSIIENTITNNGDVGILLHGAGYNNIIGNNITNNRRGILVSICYNNVIYHNNFVKNTFHIETDESNGIWDNGSEGNYWDVYTGIDSNGDGIGDTPYVIDENNQDNYPLMHHWIPHTQQSEPFPISWVVAAIAIVAVVGAALVVYFGKIKKPTEVEKIPEGVM